MADERDQPLGELVGSLSSDLATLVRSEVALAAEETRNELRRAGQAAMAASAAVALGLLAAIAGVLTAGFGDRPQFIGCGAQGVHERFEALLRRRTKVVADPMGGVLQLGAQLLGRGLQLG